MPVSPFLLIFIINYVFYKSDIVFDLLCDASVNASKANSTSIIGTYSQNNQLFSSSGNIIPYTSLPSNISHNFMLSLWFYINNWGNNIGKEKNILFSATDPTIPTDPKLQTNTIGVSLTDCGATEDLYKNINIALDKYENNLLIDIETIPSSATCAGSTYTRYIINNIPVQKWNNLTISVDSLTLDIYLDGKLINSFILNGIYKNVYANNNVNNLYLGYINSTNIGFNGFITRVRYQANSINSQEAYNIYRKGINSSLDDNFFHKYQLQVSFLQDSVVNGTFTI